MFLNTNDFYNKCEIYNGLFILKSIYFNFDISFLNEFEIIL